MWHEKKKCLSLNIVVKVKIYILLTNNIYIFLIFSGFQFFNLKMSLITLYITLYEDF